jgi:hypothetical protein
MNTATARFADPLHPGQSDAYPPVHMAADERGNRAWLGAPPRPAGLSAADRHTMAVRGSLGYAQDSADRGDYADALGWIGVLEAIGEQLPAVYQTRRQAWGRALATTGRDRREL